MHYWDNAVRSNNGGLPPFSLTAVDRARYFFLPPISPRAPEAAKAMESVTPQPVCAKEAIDLLNCAVEGHFDRDKCLRFLDALRACVLEKKVKKFSVAEHGHESEAPKSDQKH